MTRYHDMADYPDKGNLKTMMSPLGVAYEELFRTWPRRQRLKFLNEEMIAYDDGFFH